VWDQVAGQAQPILDWSLPIPNWRRDPSGVPDFRGHVEPGEPFAHMVENRHLIDVLVARAEAEGIELRATAVASFDSRSQGIDVALADGSVMAASLLVAGRRRALELRERAGIATMAGINDQSGIVVHRRPRARSSRAAGRRNIFCPQVRSRSCADGQRSSLVWTEKRAEAARIVALSEEEFHGELEQRFGLHLGEIKTLDKPRAFPLGYFRGALVHRGTAGAGRRRRACDPPDRRTGAQHGPEGCRGTRRGDRRRRAARHGPWAADVLDRYHAAAAPSTPWRWGWPPIRLNLLFSNESTLLRTVRDNRPRAGRSCARR